MELLGTAERVSVWGTAVAIIGALAYVLRETPVVVVTDLAGGLVLGGVVALGTLLAVIAAMYA